MIINKMDFSLTSLALYGVALGLLAYLLKPVYDYFRDPLDLRRFPAPTLWAAMTVSSSQSIKRRLCSLEIF